MSESFTEFFFPDVRLCVAAPVTHRQDSYGFVFIKDPIIVIAILMIYKVQSKFSG